MLKSMTGYGRGVATSEVGQLSVELSSGNRRHLELISTLPEGFIEWEPAIRKEVERSIARGHLNLRCSMRLFHLSGQSLYVNAPLARSLREAWTSLTDDLGWVADAAIPAELIAAQEGLFEMELDAQQREQLGALLMKAVKDAIANLLTMRITEGKRLEKDLQQRAHLIAKRVKSISSKSGEVTVSYTKRLEKKLTEWDQLPDHDERMQREIVIFIDRSDITEELTRLEAHLEHFLSSLDQQQAMGKTLDFLLQEMTREANTMGAKCSHIGINHEVIAIKGEIERMREQVQNVE